MRAVAHLMVESRRVVTKKLKADEDNCASAFPLKSGNRHAT